MATAIPTLAFVVGTALSMVRPAPVIGSAVATIATPLLKPAVTAAVIPTAMPARKTGNAVVTFAKPAFASPTSAPSMVTPATCRTNAAASCVP